MECLFTPAPPAVPAVAFVPDMKQLHKLYAEAMPVPTESTLGELACLSLSGDAVSRDSTSVEALQQRAEVVEVVVVVVRRRRRRLLRRPRVLEHGRARLQFRERRRRDQRLPRSGGTP